MNAYFKVVQVPEGIGLQIFPATDDGDSLSLLLVQYYLQMHQLTFDLRTLHEAVQSNVETTILLNRGVFVPIQESYKLEISYDAMSATITFFAPSELGERLPLAQFLEEIAVKKVVAGIDESILEKHVAEPQYCQPYMFALGTLPIEGIDSIVEYSFNTSVHVQPTLKEDGSVDFFQLNTINHCEKDELLAKLIPATSGKDGITVSGEPIKAQDVKVGSLKGNQNTYISEDGDSLFAVASGHVLLVGGQVCVSNIFTVDNVDTGTGNITYDGSVEVKGNVSANFSVKATGNIIIKGVVEGAYVESGADIIIERGMNGMNKGVLKATGNVIAKFIENATVEAGINVSSEAILHSTVVAGNEVSVDGKKGFIVGGKVTATLKVDAKTLGSSIGAKTIIEVGVDPHKKARYKELMELSEELHKVLESIEPIISNYAKKRQKGVNFTPEEVKYLKSILNLQSQKKNELEQVALEEIILQEEISEGKNAVIIARGDVYPGTIVTITDASMKISNQIQYSRFVKVRGDVKIEAV